ncbi:MAG: hypothetical protein R3181_05070 [Rubricoccaceae bacterium]|nr:hypothetical protein [Rubricoccaceae bacterium]
MPLLGSILTHLVLAVTLVLAAAVAGLMAFHYVRARRLERQGERYEPDAAHGAQPDTAAQRVKSAEEIAQIRARIEALMEQQQVRTETQGQHLAQKLDEIRTHMNTQDRKFDGIKSELRHEIRRRDGELDDLRHQLASALDAFWQSMPALPEGEARPPRPALPALDAPSPHTPEGYDEASDDGSAYDDEAAAPDIPVDPFAVDPYEGHPTHEGLADEPAAFEPSAVSAEQFVDAESNAGMPLDASAPAPVAPPGSDLGREATELQGDPLEAAGPPPSWSRPFSEAPSDPLAEQPVLWEEDTPSPLPPLNTASDTPPSLAPSDAWAPPPSPSSLADPPEAIAPEPSISEESVPVGTEDARFQHEDIPFQREDTPSQHVESVPDEPPTLAAGPLEAFPVSPTPAPPPVLEPLPPAAPPPAAPPAVAPPASAALQPPPLEEPRAFEPADPYTPVPPAPQHLAFDAPPSTPADPASGEQRPAALPAEEPAPEWTPPSAGGDGSAPGSAPPPAPAEPAQKDDLTVVTGITPELQEALYAAGVYTLDEMARWSRADARRISGLVGVPEEVIMHQWIFEAQSVLFEQYQSLMTR